jgi:hypothetical protein
MKSILTLIILTSMWIYPPGTSLEDTHPSCRGEMRTVYYRAADQYVWGEVTVCGYNWLFACTFLEDGLTCDWKNSTIT